MLCFVLRIACCAANEKEHAYSFKTQQNCNPNSTQNTSWSYVCSNELMNIMYIETMNVD